jgi:surface protein
VSRLLTLLRPKSHRDPDPDFVFKVVTGLSENEGLLSFYLGHPETKSVTVDWGDGTVETFDDLTDDWWTDTVSHTYLTEDEFTVRVSGDVSVLQFGWEPGCEMVTECTSFGVFPDWRQDGAVGWPGLFGACSSLIAAPSVLPVHMNALDGMFMDAVLFNGDIRNWDMSNVVTLTSMFDNASVFNQDIGGWDMGNVTHMTSMFNRAATFNQAIGGWDTGSVTLMANMFNGAAAFNQPIAAWDVSNVNNMYSMFNESTAFNQDLSGWCVTLIESRPDLFDTDATSWVLPRPVWGTCPGGE